MLAALQEAVLKVLISLGLLGGARRLAEKPGQVSSTQNRQVLRELRPERTTGTNLDSGTLRYAKSYPLHPGGWRSRGNHRPHGAEPLSPGPKC